MLIQGALLHAPALPTADFLRQVAKSAPAFYFLVEPPPGIVMSAAVDWRIVLPCASAAPLVAAGLWNAYETLVSDSAGSHPPPALLVQCRNAKGHLDQFTIGRDITDREEGIRRVESAYRLLAGSKQSAAMQDLLKDTEESGFWEPLQA